jgi:type VI secretion system protein ImpM
VTSPARPASSDEAPGWFGKLSSLGDFAHRRLSAEWVRHCDDWLSRAMRASEQSLREQWLQAYLTAPVTRFAWAPGVADASWWFGVMMPSCDSVGRYFPLVIAQSRARPPQDRIALDHLELWYTNLADAAMQTLADDASQVDTLEAALNDLPPWPTSGAFSQGSLYEWASAMARGEVLSRLAGASMWWSVSGSGAPEKVTIARGLPESLEVMVGANASAASP